MVLGVGDDGAVLECPPGSQLIAAIDSLVEDVHFPNGSPARSIGHRALAVNLSDLAAMGAQPAWALLALALPAADEAWLGEVQRGAGCPGARSMRWRWWAVTPAAASCVSRCRSWASCRGARR